MNRSNYKPESHEGSTSEGLRRDEGTAGSQTEEEGQLLAPQGNETDHDEEHEELEELEELEEDDDIHSTERTATIANRDPRRWWTKLKEFLYPNTPEDDIAGAPNYRYTPIISGVAIPFAILLEIPGLTEHWYIRTDSNRIVEIKPNPVILDVGLGFSMACALLAIIALITRFLERRVKTMTLCCVVFLTLHDIINITAVTIFGVEHRFNDGFTYGESFWMTVCSTIASTITNATLIYDLIRTPEFATSGSGLTRKQRSLIIIVIILLCYIAFGALIHCLLTELTFVDALYFTICCIETIGFGDIAMTTTGTKFFTCIYSILGILNLALAVSLTRETVIEALEASYRKRMNIIRDRMKRIRWARRVGRRWMSAVSWRLREGRKDIWVWNDELEPNPQDDDAEALGSIQKIWSMLIKSCHLFRISIVHLADRILPYQGTWEPSEKSPLWDMPHPRGMHLNLEALTEGQLEAAAMEAGVPLIELVPEKFWEKREKREKRLRKERERREKRRQREKGKGSEREKETEDEKVPLSQLDPHGSSSRTTPSSTHTLQHPSHAPSDSSIPAHSHWFDRLKRVQHDIDPEEVPLSHARLGRMIGMLGAFGMAFSFDASKFHHTGNSGPSGTTEHSPCDGFDFDAAFRQKKLKEEAATEDRKAFYAQLSVVWTLFLVFWMVGSAVFSVTEDWSFGNAMYFCVVAFTTIGFGDFSPHSPAGRSFFVLWALLGVATMTILISVIGEAYTNRYRTVLQSSGIPEFFDKAVTRYQIKERERMLLKSEARNRQEFEKGSMHGLRIQGLPYTGDSNSMALASDKQASGHEGTQAAAAHTFQTNHQHTKVRVRLEKLENLPKEILRHTKSFQDHIHYFFHGGIDNLHHSQPGHHRHSMRADDGQDDEKSDNSTQRFQGSSRTWDNHRQNMPEELKEVLDEMFLDNFGASARRFEERIAKIEREILNDGDTRRVLFTLGIERALRKMIEAAEEALESLEERDNPPSQSRVDSNGRLSTSFSQDHP